jgi:hypothetical protein
VAKAGKEVAGHTHEGRALVDGLTEERIARNNATFRDANEHISAAAGAYGIDAPVPFICECADARCSEIIRMTHEEYEEVRADSRHFLNVPGHHAAAEIVAERNGYVIVEKLGRAGEIVEALDERPPEDRSRISRA